MSVHEPGKQHNILGGDGTPPPSLGVDWIEFAQHHRAEARHLLAMLEDHHAHLTLMTARWTHLANLWPLHAPAYGAQAHRTTFASAEVGGIIGQLRKGLGR